MILCNAAPCFFAEYNAVKHDVMQSNMTFHFRIRYPLTPFVVGIKADFLLETFGHYELTDNGIKNENSSLKKILKYLFFPVRQIFKIQIPHFPRRKFDVMDYYR